MLRSYVFHKCTTEYPAFLLYLVQKRLKLFRKYLYINTYYNSTVLLYKERRREVDRKITINPHTDTVHKLLTICA
jgi:hypothetical protein